MAENISSYIENFRSQSCRGNNQEDSSKSPSADNPADVSSWGMPADPLLDCSLWWQGPPWLKLSPDQWPEQHQHLPAVLPEMKSHALTIRAEEAEEFLVHRYSLYYKLTCILAWIVRFTVN